MISQIHKLGEPGKVDQNVRVTEIYRYPVKGLSPERLETAELRPGETILFDRHYAIENGKGRFDPSAPTYLPKINFLMLMRNERLAALQTVFDPDTHHLAILRNGSQVARGDLKTRVGRQNIEQFMAAYLASELRGSPRIVQADGHSFSDVAAKCVHLVNLATVKEVGRLTGRTIDPMRFRANIYFDGLAPWKEFDWIDHKIEIAGAQLKVFARTDRCAAANVDPSSGARDLAIPATLMRSLGHSDVGIYASIETGNTIRPGDSLRLATTD